MAEPSNGTIQKLIQAGAVGICFALIGLLWLMYQTNVKTAEKMTELVEVTRNLPAALGISMTKVADDKTRDVLAAISTSCACSRIR